LREGLLGIFSGWKARRQTESAVPPERQAYDYVWDREVARLGRTEIVRRMAAVSDFRNGRSGRSGYENWIRQIEQEILKLTYEIAERERHS
jgi:hypothetical protein